MSNRMKFSSSCLLPLVILCLTTLSFITFCSHTQLDAEGHIEMSARSFLQNFNYSTPLDSKWIESGKEEMRQLEKYFSWPHINSSAIAVSAPTPLPQHETHKHRISVAPKRVLPSCPHASLVCYQREESAQDMQHVSKYATPDAERYVTFEPDVGGWNNIRMQMETVIVFAAATGRTLVLPPDQPFYLLDKGSGHQNAHHFSDFFPFDDIRKRLRVIEMKEFMSEVAMKGLLRVNGSIAYPPGRKTEFSGTDRVEKNQMWDYLRSAGHCPKWEPFKVFLYMPTSPNAGHNINGSASLADRQRLKLFAGDRQPVIYDNKMHNEKLIHFISLPGKGYRLLTHFYTFIYFEDEAEDRYYKRFVRDFVRYVDVIFCKAAEMVADLIHNKSSNGKFTSFHIRRGELQYKEVKISAADLLANVGHLLPQNQTVYIATDEKNMSFFKPFKDHFPHVYFLNDYFESAGLKSLNPNFLGMIDQVVAARGEFFVGTWFSTFSAYITRIRGYLGYADNTVWDRFQTPEVPKFPYYMREWKEAWENIDY